MRLDTGICNRHLAGIASIRLYKAKDVTSVGVDSSGENFTSVRLRSGCESMEVEPVEGSASYSERLGEKGAVEHRLEFALRGCCTDCVAELRRFSDYGVIAEVMSANGVKMLVGYSKRAGSDYPLRLISASANTFVKGPQMPQTTLLFTSIDGWHAKPITG